MIPRRIGMASGSRHIARVGRRNADHSDARQNQTQMGPDKAMQEPCQEGFATAFRIAAHGTETHVRHSTTIHNSVRAAIAAAVIASAIAGCSGPKHTHGSASTGSIGVGTTSTSVAPGSEGTTPPGDTAVPGQPGTASLDGTASAGASTPVGPASTAISTAPGPVRTTGPTTPFSATCTPWACADGRMTINWSPTAPSPATVCLRVGAEAIVTLRAVVGDRWGSLTDSDSAVAATTPPGLDQEGAAHITISALAPGTTVLRAVADPAGSVPGAAAQSWQLTVTVVPGRPRP